MSDSRQPPPAGEGFNDGFEQELMEMWQESTCPMPGDSSEQTLKLSAWVARFDRRVFLRNLVEYTAVAIVLVRSGFEIASGERPLIAPLTSIVAALFIASYIWRKHRETSPLNPEASARTYRDALLKRLDRQIELGRTVRYWYVLPVWLFFLVVFAYGAVRMLTNATESGTPFPGLFFQTVEFLLATGICVVVIWLNEHRNLRKLEKESERVEDIRIEGEEKV